MSKRFLPLGNSVYENGHRIGDSAGEASMLLAERLNAYQDRIALCKKENDRLRKELADAQESYHTLNETVSKWLAAKEGKQL